MRLLVRVSRDRSRPVPPSTARRQYLRTRVRLVPRDRERVPGEGDGVRLSDLRGPRPQIGCHDPTSVAIIWWLGSWPRPTTSITGEPVTARPGAFRSRIAC